MNLSWKQFARYLILLIGVCMLIFRLFNGYGSRFNLPIYRSNAPSPVESIKVKDSNPQATQPTSSKQEIPPYVLSVLNHVLKYQEAPPNHVGGRIFDNREKKLKLFDGIGEKIEYKEWDVHPKIKGQNRGAERIITGSDHSAYYTADHYQTFININP